MWELSPQAARAGNNSAIWAPHRSIAIERSSIAIERSSIVIERLSIAIERLSIAIERLSIVIERLSIAVERLSISIERFSIAVEHLSIVIERFSMTVERSSIAIEHVSIVIERSSIAVEHVLSVFGRRPMGYANRMEHRAALLSFFLATAGCSAVTPKPGPPRLDKPREPVVGRVVDIDYAALPMREPEPVEPSIASAHLFFEPSGEDDLIVEVRVDTEAWYLAPGVVGRKRRMCGEGEKSDRAAMWTTFRPAERSKDHMLLTLYEGTLDENSCKARTLYAWTARATAIVPGIVYAFRSASHPMKLDAAVGDPLEAETMEIIAPGAIWFASSSPSELHASELDAPFTHLEIPVERGRASSVTIDATIDKLAKFASMTELEAWGELLAGKDVAASKAPLRTASIRIEVVWGAEDSAPTAVLYVSPLYGKTSEIAEQRTPIVDP